jgi:hypothetical protein
MIFKMRIAGRKGGLLKLKRQKGKVKQSSGQEAEQAEEV